MSNERLAWGSWAVAVVLVPTWPVLEAKASGFGPADATFTIGFCAVQLGAATAGAVVASRLPANAVGWLFLALGTLLGVVLTAGAYGALGVTTPTGPLPGDDLAAWGGDWLAIPVVWVTTLFLLLLYPDGRFLSVRWRGAAIALGAVVVLAGAAQALRPGRLEAGIVNPVGLPGAAGEAVDVLAVATDVLAGPALLVAVAALVVRLRRSRGVERQQLKLFTFVSALVVLGLGVSVGASGVVADAAFLLGLLALAALPVASGVAILRHRLYDIDVVINRALVYATLTATLAGAYLAAVLLLGLALGRGSSLAVAVATLAVAALFRPARARIQRLVDRRFYRQRYDAARTDAFGLRLRDEVELDAVSADLRAVAHETLKPAHVSVWLRT